MKISMRFVAVSSALLLQGEMGMHLVVMRVRNYVITVIECVGFEVEKNVSGRYVLRDFFLSNRLLIHPSLLLTKRGCFHVDANDEIVK